MARVVRTADYEELVLPLSRLVGPRLGCRLALFARLACSGAQSLLRQQLVAQLEVYDGCEALMLLEDLEVWAVEQLVVRIEVRIHELTPGFRLLPV